MENQDEKLKRDAKKHVANRIGLIVHVVCWLVISTVILIVVPGQALGVRIGVCVLGFWGIVVAIHAACVFFMNFKFNSKKLYQRAVDREYEKLKAEQEKE